MYKYGLDKSLIQNLNFRTFAKMIYDLFNFSTNQCSESFILEEARELFSIAISKTVFFEYERPKISFQES